MSVYIDTTYTRLKSEKKLKYKSRVRLIDCEINICMNDVTGGGGGKVDDEIELKPITVPLKTINIILLV